MLTLKEHPQKEMAEVAAPAQKHKSQLRHYTLSASPSREKSSRLEKWLSGEVRIMRRTLLDPRLSSFERIVLFRLHRSTSRKSRCVSL